jgi:phosphatidylglycerophosphate synthase
MLCLAPKTLEIPQSLEIQSVQYQPTSRRPIGDAFRKTAHGAVRICVRMNIHPDAISYFSMLAAAIAALCFWKSAARPWLLLVAPAFCYLRLWCNMLDGMVALAAGKASYRGEILNDLPDRISDVLIFVGVAHSGLCSPFNGYWVALMAVMTAYVGLFGQAVGVQREFSGIMSKPWRMVTLHIGAWIAFAVLWRDLGVLLWWDPRGMRYAGFTILDWTCFIIIAGCLQTVVVRLRRIMHALKAKPKS